MLKTLPEERQAAIIEHMREHKLGETVTWLRDDGLVTSSAALSGFWSWWHLQQQFQEDESTTDTLLQQLKKEMPGISEEQLDDLGQRTFSLLSIRRQDLKGFVKVRGARFKAQIDAEKLKLAQQAEARRQEELELQRKKWMRETTALYLEWRKNKRANEIAESTSLNQPQKIEALGKQMFGELWD